MRVVERVDHEVDVLVGHGAPEHAEPQRIRGRAKRLHVEARLGQLFRRLAVADEGRDVARGVIGALSRHHHRDAGDLDHARIVGADALFLDRRHAGDLVMLADPGGSLGEDPAALGAVADVFQHVGHEGGIAELAEAGLHQHPDGGPDLDGIDAEIVGDVVEPRDVVRVFQPAIGAHQPEGLVFQRRDDLLALRPGIDVRAADHAARHAGVRRLAAARQVALANVLAAELEGLLLLVDQLAGGEVARRQPADGVGEVAHHGGAEVAQRVDRRVRVQHLVVVADRAHQLLAVVEGRHPVAVDDDRLDLLAAHHRADAAARGDADGAALGIGEGDPRDQPHILADRPAQAEAHLVAVFLEQQFRRFDIALAEIGLGILEGDLAVLVDVDHRPLVRRAVEVEPGDLELTQGEGEGAARVRFLDAAGQRALAADGEPVRVREIGARERAGGENQRVLGRQRVHFRRALLQQRFGDQVPAGTDDRLAVQFLGLDGPVAEVDVKIFSHSVRVSGSHRIVCHIAGICPPYSSSFTAPGICPALRRRIPATSSSTPRAGSCPGPTWAGCRRRTPIWAA